MNNYKIGFIGAGNMAEAIFSGALKQKVLCKEDIYLYDIDVERINRIKDVYGINSYDNIDSLVKNTDIVLLAVKPNILNEVLEHLNSLHIDMNLVSIVAGWSAEKILSYFNTKKSIRVLRTMPNMPLQYAEGMTVFEYPSNLQKEYYIYLKKIFNAIGLVSEQKNEHMDAVTSISGSGPAYVFMFIEALADAGVLNGLSRDDALLLSTQTVLGAAKTVIESGMHPAKLKDNICSPGGTTIEAVKVLEQKGFRSSIIQAADACAKKSKNL